MSTTKCLENQFHFCPKLTPDLLGSWLDARLNAMLIGERGTGKTERVLQAFKDKYGEGNFAYFSGATLDPYIHLMGVPIKEVGQDGHKYLDFVLPKTLDGNIRAIFVDEYNRAHKLVSNALMELIQFKSINGRKFPNLEVVWAAINPINEEDPDAANFYSVEAMDPAQLDRFQIIVRTANEPDREYFSKKFGNNGRTAVNWWREQPKEVKQGVSPRRLEYVLNAFGSDLDIRWLLPEKSNVQTLIHSLKKEENSPADEFFAKPSLAAFNNLIKNQGDWETHRERLVRENMWQYFPHMDQEIIANECARDKSFEATVAFFFNAGYLGYSKLVVPEDAVSSLARLHSAKKVVGVLARNLDQCLDEGANATEWQDAISAVESKSGLDIEKDLCKVFRLGWDEVDPSQRTTQHKLLLAHLLKYGVSPKIESTFKAHNQQDIYLWRSVLSNRAIQSVAFALEDK